MEFFTKAIDVLQMLVIALGGGLCVWGGINLLEGYGQDNPASNVPGAWRSNRKIKYEIDSQRIGNVYKRTPCNRALFFMLLIEILLDK